MAMFQYFKRVDGQDGQYPGSKLPDLQGALAQEVPFRAISAANTEVALLQQAGGAKVSTSKVGIPSRLHVLTAAARSINESSSARDRISTRQGLHDQTIHFKV